MPYGNYGYTPYAGSMPVQQPAGSTAAASPDREALKRTLQELVQSFMEEPAELLAPQEGPAIGHLGGT